jgi:poly-gamma-glutamate synthesis protein (capsule biosynthesis protein)
MKALFLLSFQLLFTGVFATQSDTLRLLFIGDIMQHYEQVESSRRKAKIPLQKEWYDYSGCFRYVKERFAQADITIANMETTFAGKPYTGYPSFSSPPSLLQAAHENGIDIFLTANNHICDKGRNGLEKSIRLYDSLKIPFTGIYRSRAEELEKNPMVIEKKGFRIALLNYTCGTNGAAPPAPYVVNMADTANMSMDIARSKALDPDLIIVCVHWGAEYKRVHNQQQEMIAKFLNNKGVPVIIGSHPHVPQEKQVVFSPEGKVLSITYYSLGNAISNMTAPFTRIGMMAEISLCRDSSGKADILPPQTEYVWTSRPGLFNDNYTILPVARYADSAGLFRSRTEYDRMMHYHSEIDR